MVYLRCGVEPGVFPTERLIRFYDADGTVKTALVDVHLTRSEAATSQIVVKPKAERGDRVLIALPT